MSTSREGFIVRRSVFPRRAKEQTLLNMETNAVIMEVIEANNAMEDNLRDFNLHKKRKSVSNHDIKMNNKVRCAKQKRVTKENNSKERLIHSSMDFEDGSMNCVNKSKGPVLESSCKVTGRLLCVMKLEERKDLLCTTPMTDPLGPDTFENVQWVGVKQEPLDDLEVSKVVLTELPLKSVYQSTASDPLQGSTPMFVPLTEENNTSSQDVQTDDENWDQDSPLEESSTDTEQEEFQNPEETIMKKKKKKLPQDCDICGQKLSSKANLRLHKLKIHKEKIQFTCDLCGDKFDFQREVLKHRNSTHRQEDGRFSCSFCSKSFIEYYSLSVHIKNHHSKQQETDGSNNTCFECQEAFDSEESLKEHLSSLHGSGETRLRGKLKNQEKNFICDTCGKRFAFDCLLRDHTNLHTGTKPYLCQECGKFFAQKATLKQHAKTHNDIRPFQCPECPFGFFNKGDLKKHLRKHTGERPYVCEVCGEAFSRSTHLGVHRRSHTGERPYSCDICQRGFTKRGDVVRHRRIHTGELPYLCQICGKAYRQSTQCSNHIKNQHPGAPILITKCTNALIS